MSRIPGERPRIRRGIRRRLIRWTRPARQLRRAGYRNLVDYHIHTKLCGHAVGEPEAYVREAIRKGLGEIGFADHMPLLRIRDPHLTMRPEDLPRYVEMVEEVRSQFDEIVIRLGIEMDYIPGQMDEIWEAAGGYDFDYVYGAVHFIDGWDFGDSRYLSSYHGKDRDAIYRRYFELFCEAARSGGFDIMAHPDLVKKHGIRTSLPVGEMYEAAAEALAEGGVAIEINTSGLRKKALDLYPALPFLRACAERKISVTLGSDAHAPGQVGMDFDLALRSLRTVGITQIATFSNRKRALQTLPD